MESLGRSIMIDGTAMQPVRLQYTDPPHSLLARGKGAKSFEDVLCCSQACCVTDSMDCCERRRRRGLRIRRCIKLACVRSNATQ